MQQPHDPSTDMLRTGITEHELHDAYRFARLRWLGIGYLQAIETPSILTALRNTALARKRPQQPCPEQCRRDGDPAPIQRELIQGAQS